MRKNETDADKQRRLKGYPSRVCQTMHECCLCSASITLGQVYRDGGYGRRAHEDCVVGLTFPTHKTHEWVE